MMPRLYRISAPLLAGLLFTACETRVRVYDPYRHDYHHWMPMSASTMTDGRAKLITKTATTIS
jgi:hypothetical protein